jgi:hypothetical protein
VHKNGIVPFVGSCENGCFCGNIIKNTAKKRRKKLNSETDVLE